MEMRIEIVAMERWLQPASPSSVSERTWIPENHDVMSVMRAFFTAEAQREDEVTERRMSTAVRSQCRMP
jgi:hypothetical protein